MGPKLTLKAPFSSLSHSHYHFKTSGTLFRLPLRFLISLLGTAPRRSPLTEGLGPSSSLTSQCRYACPFTGILLFASLPRFSPI